MMDSPFYGRSYWNVPSSSRTRPHSHNSPSVRVIPVHYVGSEQRPSRSDSAVKIQKVFRGFLVRKSFKKIAEIRSEVEEIEKRISKEETIGSIGRDSKERLRINEMLMSLLFRLDSVRGVDSGVRDCRKTVIKKVIALQEFLDAVVSSNNKNGQIIEDDVVDNVGKVVEAVDQNQEDGENHDDSMPEETEVVEYKEIVKSREEVEDKETVTISIDDRKDREVVEDYDAMPTVSDCPEESVGTSQTESQADSSANPETLIEACEEDDNSQLKHENNAIETNKAENKEVNVKENSGAGEDNTRNRELLERMMEDNEKMMDMMAQLFERNEMQTRMLSSLSQRVEQLERAFMCERLRRKKKRQAAATVDGCQTSPDNKKCGKR